MIQETISHNSGKIVILDAYRAKQDTKAKILASLMLAFFPVTVVVIGINFLWHVLYEFAKELCEEKA